MELADFRAAFPLLRSRAYLFSGGLCPLAEPVERALSAWVARWNRDPLEHRADYFGDWDQLRAEFARLVGAGADDVAVIENTSRANNLAARMLAPPGGGVVLVDRTTYPSAAYPWMLLHGVEVREVVPEPDQAWHDAFAAAAGDQVVAFVVSHVSPLTGERHDLGALAEVANANRARLVVDAAQSLGVVPVDLDRDGVDVITTTAMKWLLGPPGVAFLAAREDVSATGSLADVGYVAANLADEYPLTTLPDYPKHARSVEVGLAALPLLAGAGEGLRLLHEVGIPRIHARVEELATLILAGLKARGFEVMTPDDPSRRAGVVAFLHPHAVQAAAALRGRGVDVWGYPSGRVRVDPHGFNDETDVARFLEELDAVPAW